MKNVRPRFPAHTVLFSFLRPLALDRSLERAVAAAQALAAAAKDRHGVERAPQMPRSTTSVCALAGDRLRVPRPGGVERWDADERRPPRSDGRGSSLCTWSLSSFVNGGRWVVWCARQLVSLQNSSVRCCWCREFSSKGQPPVLVCNSVSILCGSRQGKRCEMAFGPMTTI